MPSQPGERQETETTPCAHIFYHAAKGLSMLVSIFPVNCIQTAIVFVSAAVYDVT